MKNFIYYNSVAAHPHHQMGITMKTIRKSVFQCIRDEISTRINKKKSGEVLK